MARRQLDQILRMGRVKPPTKIASCTPDCFIPVTVPRRPSGARSEISLLVAGLQAPCPYPEMKSPNISPTTEVAIATINSPIPEESSTRTHDHLPPYRSLKRPERGAHNAPTMVFTETPAPNIVSDMPRSFANAVATTAVPTIGNAPNAIVRTKTVISTEELRRVDGIFEASDSGTVCTLR